MRWWNMNWSTSTTTNQLSFAIVRSAHSNVQIKSELGDRLSMSSAYAWIETHLCPGKWKVTQAKNHEIRLGLLCIQTIRPRSGQQPFLLTLLCILCFLVHFNRSPRTFKKHLGLIANTCARSTNTTTICWKELLIEPVDVGQCWNCNRRLTSQHPTVYSTFRKGY